MASKFKKTKDELRESYRRAGKKQAAREKMDKAFGWTKHPKVRTSLSENNPIKKEGEFE